MTPRPRVVAGMARLMTTVGQWDALAGGWAVFWNELLDGAPPGAHRAVAASVTALGRALTAPTSTASWLREAFHYHPAP